MRKSEVKLCVPNSRPNSVAWRQHGTERPLTRSLNAEERDGISHCVCCGEALFEAATKFDSGMGWPSFCSDQGGGGRNVAHLRGTFQKRPSGRLAYATVNGVAMEFEPKAQVPDSGG